MLKRKTPLKAKKYWNPKRKPLRSVSKKKVSLNKHYANLKKDWFSKEENRYCIPCREIHDRSTFADQVHHKKGRIGALLCDTEFWLPVCALHHSWIHANPYLAYSRKYLIKH